MAKKIKWHETSTAAQNARRELPALAKEYFVEGRAIARGKPSPAALRRFIVRTRRFGYTLELFHSFYGPRLAQRLDALHRIGRFAEELSDCVSGRRIFGRQPDARLQRFLDDCARRKLAEFRTFWLEQVDAKGQERAWRDYLARARQSP